MSAWLNRCWPVRFALATLVVCSAIGCSSSSRPSASSSTQGSGTSDAAARSGTASSADANSVTSLASPSACGLLATSDIQNGFGGTVAAGSPTDAPDGSESICDWTVTKPDGSGVAVQLDVHARRSTADWVQQRQIDPAPSQTVGGLGDDAFSQTVSAGGQVFDDLWVRQSSINFRLEVLSDLGPGPLEPLARTVLTHL